MRKLKINPQVYDDLNDIKQYISKDNPEQANKVISENISDIERLQEFPEIGSHLNNKIHINAKYRYIITYSYATIYYLDNSNIYVITVLHLKRDFSAINFDILKND